MAVSFLLMFAGSLGAAVEPDLFAVTVRVEGAGVVIKSPDSEFYTSEEVVTLTAAPAKWHAFSGWGDGDTSNPRTITVLSNQTYLAIFTNTVPLERTFYPVKQWDHSYGGGGDDVLVGLQTMSDGGALLAGHSRSETGGSKETRGSGGFDYWLVKVDGSGNQQWEQSFGGSELEFLDGVHQMSDGGYVLVGESGSGASGNKLAPNWGREDFWVLKLDADGGKQWELGLGGEGSEQFPASKETAEGGVVLAGYSDSRISGNKITPGWGGYDYWVVKIGSNGTKEWERTFGGPADDFVSAVLPTADGRYLVVGSSYSDVGGNKALPGYGFFDYWVVKTAGDGSKLWERVFGGAGDDLMVDVQETPDGGAVLAGYSSSDISGNKTTPTFGGYDYWVLKIDSDGNKVWEVTFGGGGQDILSSLRQTSDGGSFLGGYSDSPTSGNKTTPNYGAVDCWVVKIDASGSKEWERTFGGSGDEFLTVVEQTRDAGLLFGGTSNSGMGGNKLTEGYGHADYWVVKTDRAGDLEWEQTWGGSRDDVLRSIPMTSEGDLLLGGYSASGFRGNKSTSGYGAFDYWVVKIASMKVPVGTPLALVNGLFALSGSVTVGNSAVVSLRTSFADGAIFYTVDGSQPDRSSTPYSAPFAVTTSSTLRAVAYSPDFTQVSEADPIQVVVLPTYSLSATTAGGGTLELDPPKGPYLSNTVVEVVVRPDDGWTFMYWTGQVNSSNSMVTVRMDEDKSIQAVFGTFVKAATDGNGEVVVEPATGPYPYGSSVRMTAIPRSGFYLVGWERERILIGDTNPLIFFVTQPHSLVKAVFSPPGPGQFTLTSQTIGRGTVTATPQANVYTNGQTVTLTAIGSDDEVFASWSGDANGYENPLTILIDRSRMITANFARPGFVVDSMFVSPQGFGFTLLGQTGAKYQIDWGTDLRVWARLITVTNTTPRVDIVDDESKPFPRRFYRFKRVQ